MLKFRYLLLIFLLLFETSIVQARGPLTIRNMIQSTYQHCVSPLLQRVRHINQSPPIESEQQLREQGYDDKYIAGLDHVRENLRLVERLRKDKVDPHTSHIQEFAELIDIHIAFIEEGIQSQNFSNKDKEMRLNLLESLKSEAQEHQDSQKVTYRYWFNLNFRLSILATPIARLPIYLIDITTLIANKTIEDTIQSFQKLEKIIQEGYKQDVRSTWHNIWYLIDSFPERVIIPTKHQLGQVSINETHGTGVHFVGLNNKPIPADGTNMHPYQFFLHDIAHAYQAQDIDNPQLAAYVRQEINRLPKPQRQVLWYIFYEITYEKGYTFGLHIISPVFVQPEQGINEEDLSKGEATLIRILKRNPYVTFENL